MLPLIICSLEYTINRLTRTGLAGASFRFIKRRALSPAALKHITYAREVSAEIAVLTASSCAIASSSAKVISSELVRQIPSILTIGSPRVLSSSRTPLPASEKSLRSLVRATAKATQSRPTVASG